MKKVRFESPMKVFEKNMDNLECHSPRPFLRKHEICHDLPSGYTRLLPYNPDPVQRFECSNSSPYPAINKTTLEACQSEPRWTPNYDLDLSMLDNFSHEPRKPIFSIKQGTKTCEKDGYCTNVNSASKANVFVEAKATVLSSIENTKHTQPHSDDNFFIRKDNLFNINTLQREFKKLSLDKENIFLAKKAEKMTLSENMGYKVNSQFVATPEQTVPDECRCDHCVRIIQNAPCSLSQQMTNNTIKDPCCNFKTFNRRNNHCECLHVTQADSCHCHYCTPLNCTHKKTNCNKLGHPDVTPKKNIVDKKSWTIQRYEHGNNQDCMEVEKQTTIVKEKREPTVSDLFKIIKLQNEQLQLLQEKVDKFISANSSQTLNAPVQNCLTEHVALQSVDSEDHKISIGVMTSFEMVRTSTIINKEIVTQSNENAQIQCNRSQISIKEVISKTQPGNSNFLDGIKSGCKRSTTPASKIDSNNCNVPYNRNICEQPQQPEDINEEKTLNELSLYNVQVDNATTPLISPEQSLYLDVRDYSDSESGSDDQSNVGWTYYNKVMTHVNGMLQDSDMPSSASALYRNTRQQCVQMQIDKANVSVAKRVKFGDDPLGIHQPHLYTAATDTSLKMNQLAAKYLKSGILPSVPQNVLPVAKPSMMPIDMSFATRNYMERHRILQGSALPPRSPPAGEIPKFLDITALKQQPKLL